jgi:hypothetical protein
MTTGTHPYVVPDVIDENLIDADIVETKLVVDETDVNMGTGGTVHALTYNGAIPGPTFRLNVGDTVIVRLINHLMHPWVIPVVACDPAGWPLEQSNLGRSIGSRGLGAPGQDIASLAPRWRPGRLGGYQHRGAVCHRRGRAAVVGVPGCGRRGGQARVAFVSGGAAHDGRPAVAGRLEGIRGVVGKSNKGVVP